MIHSLQKPDKMGLESRKRPAAVGTGIGPFKEKSLQDVP